MQVVQFVMAYRVEQDRLRAILPDDFLSLRPVLRINAEIRDDRIGYVEFNTPVEKEGIRGWLNIGYWLDVPFERVDNRVTFKMEFLELSFSPVGIEGSCPAEKDNDGCFFLDEEMRLRPTEQITARKEFCDCSFRWSFTPSDAHGMSIGKTMPAYPTEIKHIYQKELFTVKNAAKIPCEIVLGTYLVKFERII